MKRFFPLILVCLISLNSCGLSGSLGTLKEKMPGMPSMPKIAMPKMPSLPKVAMPSLPKMPKIAMPKMPKMPEMKGGDMARFSFRDLFPARVPVVEVREHELKELQLGKEKAIAYEKSGGFFSSWFGKPLDFKEPELPAGGLDNPEFGLLPPKSE